MVGFDVLQCFGKGTCMASHLVTQFLKLYEFTYGQLMCLSSHRTKRRVAEGGDKDVEQSETAAAASKKAKLKTKISSGFGNFDSW